MTSKEKALERAREHAAKRERVRLARERLAVLRKALKDALAAKKTRMRALKETCRTERLALRDRLRAMRAEGLAQIREHLRTERAAARAACLEAKRHARATLTRAVDIVRAEIAAERQQRATETRLARAHRIRLAAHKKAQPLTEAETHAALGPFAPLLESGKRAPKPAAGESRAEAVLKHGGPPPFL